MAQLKYPTRPSQQQVLSYTGGRLGVTAVPGAGKTHLLSALAAKIIAENRLLAGQELLIVTLVNAAVENLKSRIAAFFEQPALALYKYRVRTLHGLAHDIVRERPGQVGLETQFGIVDERGSQLIRSAAVQAWLSTHPGELARYFIADARGEGRGVRSREIAGLLEDVVLAFIRTAKDRRLTPDELGRLTEHSLDPLPLARLCIDIYTDYQHSLAYRGAVDFDDLIRLALDLLESDEGLLVRLRDRYPYVLEDEAQDSSISQERILRLLAGETGNWVRVGDPNQAIFETFTTASPELLRAFVRENVSQEIPESGRSQPAIIALANQLVDWVTREHPSEEARTALGGPHIARVPEGDAQPNPPEDPSAVRLVGRGYRADDELDAVVTSLQAWLPQNPGRTVAVLAPRNARGAEVISALRAKGIEAIELLGSTLETRRAAGALISVLTYIAEPGSSSKLADAYSAWRSSAAATTSGSRTVEANADEGPHPKADEVKRVLLSMSNLEAYIAPSGLAPALRPSSSAYVDRVLHELQTFGPVARGWLEAAVLPIDQLVLTLAQELFREPADLALAHRLALLLGQAGQTHRAWRLPELIAELREIASNERGYLGLSGQGSGFDPSKHAGQVVVTTMHKAKGLEWDRVYLTSVNDYDFPSGQEGDSYQSEKYFVRDRLNLQAEALDQLSCLQGYSSHETYEAGRGTRKARTDYVRERLRLMYVGITRAKRELVVTWNTGRRGTARQALAFAALQQWWRAAGPKDGPTNERSQPSD